MRPWALQACRGRISPVECCMWGALGTGAPVLPTPCWGALAPPTVTADPRGSAPGKHRSFENQGG